MMRRFLLLLPLLALSAPALAQAELEGLGATLVRRGSGKRLYLVTQRVGVGAHGRFAIGGEPPLVASDGDRLLARKSAEAAWAAVEGHPALLFPELAGEAAVRARFRPGEGGGLVPIREEDRAIVESVSIERGPEGRPERVVVALAGGGREQRDYSGWTPVSGGLPESAGATEGSVSWPPEAAWGSALETRLEALRAKVGKLEDLSGRYVREKRTILLAKPSVARGRFLFVPGRLLWIDEEPRESSVLLTRESMEIYDPANRRLERFLFGESEIGKYVFLGFGDSLAEGLRSMRPVEFAEEGGRLRLGLVPAGGPLAKHVTRLSLVLDRESGLLTEMSYEDPSGDSVTTKLVDVARNTGVAVEDVAIRPAEGTRIVTNEGGLPWR